MAIRDSAVDAFTRPFPVNHIGQAMRGFTDEVNRTDSEMNKHPSDYELFELGTFDEETGKFENLESPRSLARAKDVKVSTP